MTKPVGHPSITTLQTLKAGSEEARQALLEQSQRLQAAISEAEDGLRASYQATATLQEAVTASTAASQNLGKVIVHSEEVNRSIVDDEARRAAEVAAAEAARRGNGCCESGNFRFKYVVPCVAVVCCIGTIALAAFAFAHR